MCVGAVGAIVDNVSSESKNDGNTGGFGGSGSGGGGECLCFCFWFRVCCGESRCDESRLLGISGWYRVGVGRGKRFLLVLFGGRNDNNFDCDVIGLGTICGLLICCCGGGGGGGGTVVDDKSKEGICCERRRLLTVSVPVFVFVFVSKIGASGREVDESNAGIVTRRGTGTGATGTGGITGTNGGATGTGLLYITGGNGG